MIITLSGRPGSGKSTVAKLVAQKLGYTHFSTGDLRGQIAMKHSLTIDQLNEIGKTERWTDEECDNLVEKMGKEKDNIVFDSWLAWHFIPQSIKIFLDVDLREAAKRIFRHQRPDEEHKSTMQEVQQMITQRMMQTAGRYKKWYGVDFLDTKNYDYIIDTTSVTPNQVAEKVVEIVNEKMQTIYFKVPHIFEITERGGRTIRLTKERWKHIKEEHPNINDIEEVKRTIINPLKIMPSKYDPENVRYYYMFNKTIKMYLMAAVKYLNGEGFIITAYYIRK